MGANSTGMNGRMHARLRCRAESGVFSHESLVHFADAAGGAQSALVDTRHISGADGHAWLNVRQKAARDSRVLIVLPTADQDRLWVRADDIETQVAR